MERPAVLDAHVHFWDPGQLTYPWLGDVPPLHRPFLPPDYRAATPPTQVAAVMFVECNCSPAQNFDEIALIERLCHQDGRIGGIVAYLDLTDERSRTRTLEQLAEHPRVKGVRQNIQGNPAGFALQRSFVEGVRAAAAAGLTFDLCVTHDQLPEAAELVARCPAAKFVLDHCGKPAVRQAAIEPWGTHIRTLAAFENVCCKISGLLTEAARPWQAADVTPYMLHAIEAFGIDRVLFGSDWPVVTLAAGFQDWYDLSWHLAACWSPSEQRRFYHDNAINFYGLTNHVSTER